MAEDRKKTPGISLESAQREAQQQLRVFGHAVAGQLDREFQLAIEVNGTPVGTITCMDSALSELAAGWSLLNRFCISPRDFDSVSVDTHRASVMVRGGIDITGLRNIRLGESFQQPSVPEPFPVDSDWSIPEDVLLDILREVWSIFRSDRLSEGSIHAALASENGPEVVAFDIIPESAVAKVLGWCLVNDQLPAYEILVVNGMVTRAIVDAAVRMGVRIIATPFVPSSDAYLVARVAAVSIVGYMRHQNPALFGNGDIVILEDEVE